MSQTAEETIADEAGEAPEARPVAPGTVVVVGLVLAAALVGAIFLLMGRTTYDVWGAFLVAPAIVALSLPALSRQAAREEDRGLFWLLVAALLLKLGAAIAAEYFAFVLYGGDVDVAGYHARGAEIAERFRAGNFDTGLKGLTGNRFPILLNAFIYTVIGPTRTGGFMVHGWLGFWGLFLCYRAFTLSVPEGRRRTYARLVFFLPSLLLWSSWMGKDPWMVFGLGIAVFGAARILTGQTWRGLPMVLLGLWLMTLVRPHVAGMVAIALAGAALLKRFPERLRQLAPIARFGALIALLAVALVFATKTQAYLQEQGIDTEHGLEGVLQEASLGGAYGGSVFSPPIVRSPRDVPFAGITVLFRPFLTEAGSQLEVVSALEGTFLLLLSLVRIRWGIAALLSVKRQPIIAFAVVYVLLFVVAFSSFANFGLLSRQRIQVLPVYLFLLCVPPRMKREAS